MSFHYQKILKKGGKKYYPALLALHLYIISNENIYKQKKR